MDRYLNKDLLPETALLELLANDDAEVFNLFYNRYWKDLYKTAFWVLKDNDQSMDIVQDVFIWLWEHRKQLTVRTTLKSYLLAAVKFKAANFIRNYKLHDGFFKEIESLQLQPNNSPEMELEVKELEYVIQQAIELLPDKCKAVYKLSRNEKLSNQKIAAQLGISVKTVENQMTIALKRLRSALAHATLLIFLLIR